MKKLTLFFALFLILPFQASAWGPVGHETIAYIAQDNLSPVAKEKLKSILDPGEDLVSITLVLNNCKKRTPPTEVELG